MSLKTYGIKFYLNIFIVTQFICDIFILSSLVKLASYLCLSSTVFHFLIKLWILFILSAFFLFINAVFYTFYLSSLFITLHTHSSSCKILLNTFILFTLTLIYFTNTSIYHLQIFLQWAAVNKKRHKYTVNGKEFAYGSIIFNCVWPCSHYVSASFWGYNKQGTCKTVYYRMPILLHTVFLDFYGVNLAFEMKLKSKI